MAPVATAPAHPAQRPIVERSTVRLQEEPASLSPAGYLPYILLQGVPGKSGNSFTLIARGLDATGRLRHLSFERNAMPDEPAWAQFVGRLDTEWPACTQPRLVVVDHSPGLMAAVSAAWPAAHLQLCWSQELRLLLESLAAGDEAPCLAGAWAIAEAESHADAVRIYAAWARRWRDRYPEAVAAVQGDLPLLLAFLAEPEGVRRALRAADIAFGGTEKKLDRL